MFPSEIIIIPAIFIGLPWIVLHYMTKWKTAATLTVDDEVMLDELYQLARRLDDRMDTVERLVASDNPDFKPSRLMHDRETDNVPLREIERQMAQRTNAAKERNAR
jgi:phage shock protein B